MRSDDCKRKRIDKEAIAELRSMKLPAHLKRAVDVLALFYGANKQKSLVEEVFGSNVQEGRTVSYSYAVLKEEGHTIAGVWIAPVLAKLKMYGVVCKKDDLGQTITITEVQKHDI